MLIQNGYNCLEAGDGAAAPRPEIGILFMSGYSDDSLARDMEQLMKQRFWRSLIAVLAGNAIYFSVEHLLPPRGQHQPFHIDWGLVIDFWMCLVCYGIVRLVR
jgi:hypothetical protein